MCSGTKDIGPILRELFPSEEMASYLARCPFKDENVWQSRYCFDDAPPEKLPLSRHQMAKAVTGAPSSLERKRELFLLLAEGEEDGFFSAWADAAAQAVQRMQPEPGEFFYVTACRYDESTAHIEEETVGTFFTWESIFEAAQDHRRGDVPHGHFSSWLYVEKWTADENGQVKSDCSYTVIDNEAWFCYRGIYEECSFEGYVDPNLPVPFHAGDIVTVDCRPFASIRHVVILEIGDNCDCCCLQALYDAGDGYWNTGAVKHGYIFPNHHSPELSPLYRLASFHGQLSKEERLLEQVSRYVNGDEERGSDLWHYIYELCEDRRNRTVTEDEILSYITDEGV